MVREYRDAITEVPLTWSGGTIDRERRESQNVRVFDVMMRGSPGLSSPIPCPICGAPLKFVPDNPVLMPFFECAKCLRAFELSRGCTLRRHAESARENLET